MSDCAYCVEYFYAKPDCLEDLQKSLQHVAMQSKAEPGCLQYDLLQDSNNENVLIIVLKYTDQAAMKAHESQPYVTDFMKSDMDRLCEKVTWNDARLI